jgi:hypothetical protein
MRVLTVTGMDIYNGNRKREENGNMGLFACNACRYFFEADALPDTCPNCHLDSVLGSTDSGRRVSFPAVRAATEAEVKAYEEVGKAAQEERDFLEWLDSLSSYDLSNDEYHVALMLLHSFRTTPDLYTKHFTNDLLPAKKGGIEGWNAQAMARILYIDVKKSFTSKINQERQNAGTNDIVKVAAQTPPDSAANVLRRFRQNEITKIFRDPQNLGDIRRVDLEKVVLEPSDGYLRFLTEWYNSMA